MSMRCLTPLIFAMAGPLCAAVDPPPPDCGCSGEASLFSIARQYIELRLEGELSSTGQGCRVLAGEVKRLYTHRKLITGQPVVNRLSPRSAWLRQKPLGFRLSFHCTMSHRGTIDEITWVID